MAVFRPEFEGELTLESVPDDWTTRIQRRLEEGLLAAGHRGRRTDYRVEAMETDSIAFASRGFLTREVHAYGPRVPAMFWGMISFWGVFFPWLGSAFHRRFAEKALRRILSETLSSPTAGRSAAWAKSRVT